MTVTRLRSTKARTRSGSVLTGLLPFVVASVQFLGSAGCMRVTNPMEIAIAPDSSVVTCVVQDDWLRPWVDGGAWQRSISLDVAKVASPQRRINLPLGPLGPEFAFESSDRAQIVFSPDSRRVGVLAGRRLWVVDLASLSRRLCTRPEEHATSCSWTDKGELAYGVVARDRRSEGWTATRLLLIARPDQPVETRRKIYSTAADHMSDWKGRSVFGGDYWGPGARYVIFADRGQDDRLVVLDVASGQAKHVGRRHVVTYSAAWKQDGSRAFCLTSIAGEQLQAMLVFAPSMAVQDLSSGAEVLNRESPGLPMFWTTDGHYVADPLLGYLIRPVPWEVLVIGRSVQKTLDMDERAWPQFVFLPVPGYIGALAWSKEGTQGLYAVSYDGRSCRELATSSGGIWAVSADGSLAAVVSNDRVVRLHRVDASKLATRGRDVEATRGITD